MKPSETQGSFFGSAAPVSAGSASHLCAVVAGWVRLGDPRVRSGKGPGTHRGYGKPWLGEIWGSTIEILHACLEQIWQFPELLVVASGFYGSKSSRGVSRELPASSGTLFPDTLPRSVKKIRKCWNQTIQIHEFCPARYHCKIIAIWMADGNCNVALCTSMVVTILFRGINEL